MGPEPSLLRRPSPPKSFPRPRFRLKYRPKYLQPEYRRVGGPVQCKRARPSYSDFEMTCNLRYIETNRIGPPAWLPTYALSAGPRHASGGWGGGLWFLFIPILICASSVGAQAQATESDARSLARELGVHGIEAYRASDFDTAAERLDRAFRMFPTPTLGLWSARARLKLGRWVDAAARFDDTARCPKEVGDVQVQAQALRDAAAELAALRPRMPRLTVEIQAPAPHEVAVLLDGVPMPQASLSDQPVDPGTHQVVGMWGEERREESIEVAEADRPIVRLVFAQPSSSTALSTSVEPNVSSVASSGQDVDPLRVQLGIAAVGVGGIGLVAAGVLAVAAVGKCPDSTCKSTDDEGAYNALKLGSTVAFWAGAGFGAAGAVALFLGPGKSVVPSKSVDSHPPIGWVLAPDGVRVRGSF